jgi:hypothetical protein
MCLVISLISELWKCIHLGCYLWWEFFIVVISGMLKAIDVECAWWASNERSIGRPQRFPSHQWDKFAQQSLMDYVSTCWCNL